MKTAAMPAAELSEQIAATWPRLFLVTPERVRAAEQPQPEPRRHERHDADDLDDMWDNLPV